MAKDGDGDEKCGERGAMEDSPGVWSADPCLGLGSAPFLWRRAESCRVLCEKVTH